MVASPRPSFPPLPGSQASGEAPREGALGCYSVVPGNLHPAASSRDCIAPPPGTITVTPGNRSCGDATRGVNRSDAGSSRGWTEAGSDQTALHLPCPLSAHPRPESRGQGALTFRGPQQRITQWAGDAGREGAHPLPSERRLPPRASHSSHSCWSSSRCAAPRP